MNAEHGEENVCCRPTKQGI